MVVVNGENGDNLKNSLTSLLAAKSVLCVIFPLQYNHRVFLAAASALPHLFISSFCGLTALVSPSDFTATNVSVFN